MKSRILLALGIAILISSCVKEPAVSFTGSDPVVQPSETNHRMSQGEAVAVLENFMATMDENDPPATRSAAQTRISQVRTARSSDYSRRAEITRSSGSEEVLFYEMTLENGDGTEGFAVVVGDQRFPEVIAYCPYGSLADTTNIPAMAMFFREAAELIHFEPDEPTGPVVPVDPADPKIPLDPGELEPGNPAAPTNPGYTPPLGRPAVDHMQTEKITFYRSLSETEIIWDYFYMEDDTPEADWPWWIHEYYWTSNSWVDRLYDEAMVPFRWHQYTPYNNKVTVTKNGVRAPIGCVPLAIGSIMAYHRYPETYNWDAINQRISIPTGSAYSTAQNAVSQMLYDVAGLLNTTWNFDTSERGVGSTKGFKDGRIIYMESTLKSLGYTYEESVNGSSISIDTLINNFNRGLPIMISCIGSLNNLEAGHAWVVDGLMVRRHYYYDCGWANYDFINNTYDRVSLFYVQRVDRVGYMMHCLWGWEGEECNGWYFNLIPIDFSRGYVTFSGYPKALYTNIKPAE